MTDVTSGGQYLALDLTGSIVPPEMFLFSFGHSSENPFTLTRKSGYIVKGIQKRFPGIKSSLIRSSPTPNPECYFLTRCEEMDRTRYAKDVGWEGKSTGEQSPVPPTPFTELGLLFSPFLSLLWVSLSSACFLGI